MSLLIRSATARLYHAAMVVLLGFGIVQFTVLPAMAASPYSDAELIDGFEKTVFGSEFSNPFAPTYARKFTGPVRFYVASTAGNAKRAQVQAFVSGLRTLIFGLRVQLVSRENDANFVVHVVQRRDYARTVREKVHQGANFPVRGRCMVRSKFSPSGITRSDAVIVADEGEPLFRRCMTEEILQGLGPLNDDPTLKHSMFNDTSRFTSFRRFDRLILNMLYDSAVRAGATRAQVVPLLPGVLRRVRARVEGRR